MSYKTTWLITKGVIITFSGVVDEMEIFQAVAYINSDLRFDEIRYQIRDYTKVTEFNVDSECMIYNAALDKAASYSNPNMKIAIVTAVEVIQVLSSLYQVKSITSSPWKVKIFNTMDEAHQWVQ